MAAYLNLPSLAHDFLKPSRVAANVVGNVISGGANGVGESITMDLSCGGMVTYELDANASSRNMEVHNYLDWLSARLNGGFRFINVPIWTDAKGPFPVLDGKKRAIIKGIPHSDGSLFSDGSGYSQATVWGEVTENAALNAGILKMRVYGLSRPLQWSDWFSIYHADKKGWRAYRHWEVLSATDETNPVYTLALQPPLRAAVPAGTRVEFARPLCAMKFAADFNLPSETPGNYVRQVTLKFVEAF
ncbi:hypothetical protein [Martelella endophytica]|uniref:Uncharacterized protein n=1 Tax=Martelella endophytica TaxID=1486262 RepID=A0A0D5LLL6_MAREN|nr:hypothetical protein [Martelella endophytica]AJY44662.1 hypothetical protein TM49_01535 [Martelella endophytica]